MNSPIRRTLVDIAAAVPAELRESFIHLIETGEFTDELAARAESDVSLQDLLDEALQSSLDEVVRILSPATADTGATVDTALKVLAENRPIAESPLNWDTYVANIERQLEAEVGNSGVASALQGYAAHFARAAAEVHLRNVIGVARRGKELLQK